MTVLETWWKRCRKRGREGGRVLIYLHVPAKIKGHERANNDGDRSMMEEMQEGHLPEGAAEDEEVGVEVLEILYGGEGGREGGREGEAM